MTHAHAHRTPAYRRRPALGLAAAAALATLAAATLAATLTATLGASPARALVSGTFFVPAGAERVAWLYPGLTGRQAPQITQIGPWARTDYARFAGPAGQGELLFKTANHGPYVLSHAPGLARLARSWNHLRGRIRGWHPARVVRSYQADTTFRRAVLDDGRSCVVFSGEGQPVAYDQEARPGLIYFGYFCARPGKFLDDGEARALVTALRLVYDRRTPRPEHGPSREAEAIAKGSPAERTGNARFPFPLATPYNETDGFRVRP